MNAHMSIHRVQSAHVSFSSPADKPSWWLTFEVRDTDIMKSHSLTIFFDPQDADAVLAGFGWTRDSFDALGGLRERAEASS